MPLRLIQPSSDYISSYLEALREGLHSGMGPMAESEILKIEKAPDDFLARINGPQPTTFTQKDGKVVPWLKVSRLWTVDHKEIVGIVNVRHELNDLLRIVNGNIGYGIRPSRQRKGLGVSQLKLALKYFHQETGYPRALMCCYSDNIASRRVIEKSGGLLLETETDPDEPYKTILRFWVDLPPS